MISPPDLERRLQALAAGLDWPAPADVAARLQLPDRRRTSWLRPAARLALAGVVVLVLAFSAVLIASPSTRTAVARLLGFPGVTVVVPVPSDARAPSQPLPTMTGIDIGTPMTLAQAQTEVDFPLRTLPLPGAQVSFDAGAEAVHITYRGADGVVLFTQLAGEADLGFVKQASGVTPAEVDGVFALWATGPRHALLRVDDGRTLQAKLSANALLWSRGGVTYRLETDTDLEEAVLLAERLR